jgi:hypothetical protein
MRSGARFAGTSSAASCCATGPVPMPALGQKQTFAALKGMSAFPPKAEIWATQSQGHFAVGKCDSRARPSRSRQSIDVPEKAYAKAQRNLH